MSEKEVTNPPTEQPTSNSLESKKNDDIFEKYNDLVMYCIIES